MSPFVYHAYQEEQAASDDTMVEHLQGGTVQRNRRTSRHISGTGKVQGCCCRRDTQKHITHMTHRRICDQSLQVPLGQADQCTVHDTDHRQRSHDGSIELECRREDRQHNPQDAVGAKLEQDAGQDYATGCGSGS